MFVGSPRALAMAGVALVGTFALPAQAQGNPFKPASAASRQEIAKIIKDEIAPLRKDVDELKQAQDQGGAVPAFGPGGAPLPGSPVIGPGAPGAPIGMDPMMPPAGFPGAPEPSLEEFAPEPPKGPVEALLVGGGRFIGCINGAPKFSKKSGERVVFAKADISEAISAGVVPECR